MRLHGQNGRAPADWVIAVLPSFVAVLVVLLGAWLARRASDRQWQRQRESDTERWSLEREADANRWADQQRHELYKWRVAECRGVYARVIAAFDEALTAMDVNVRKRAAGAEVARHERAPGLAAYTAFDRASNEARIVGSEEFWQAATVARKQWFAGLDAVVSADPEAAIAWRATNVWAPYEELVRVAREELKEHQTEGG